MSNKAKTVFVLVVALLNLSFSNDHNNRLLDSSDLSLVSESGPTITRDDGMESFWKWRCYPTEIVSVKCIRTCEESEDNACFELSFSVEEASQQDDFDFENHRLYESDCHQRSEWLNKFITSQNTVCFLGAYLQDIEPNWGLWILYQMKTAKGTFGYDTTELIEGLKFTETVH